MEQSIADHEAGRRPNAMMGLQVVVNRAHRGKAWSRIAVAEMVALAARKGIGQVIVPVRPIQKSDFPLIPMNEYVAWHDGRGLPRDNWLRVHVEPHAMC